jgi:hypothetical protein
VGRIANPSYNFDEDNDDRAPVTLPETTAGRNDVVEKLIIVMKGFQVVTYRQRQGLPRAKSLATTALAGRGVCTNT